MKRIYYSLIIAGIMFFTAGIAGAQNLATNPGFEDWTVNGAPGPPDSWQLSSTSITGAQEATTIHGGTYSVNLTWTTTSTVRLEQTGIPVTEGNNYQFTFWAYDNDPGGRLGVAVRWFDGASGLISGYYGDHTSDSPSWQQLSSGPQTAPAGAATASIEVRVYDVSSGWTGSATCYVDDVVFEDVSGAPPTITDAFAISTTEVDVYYSEAMTAVDPGDYYMTGTAYTTFSTATIDPGDPTLVHLAGAIPAMTGDITVDVINDDNFGTSFSFYAGIMPIAYTNAANPGGTMNTGIKATFQGIVSANDGFNNVWFADAAGGYNGVMIYDYNLDGQVAVGDEILLTAFYSPFNNLNELNNPDLISVVSTGNSPYGPDLITGNQIEETIPADTYPAESWEGQLVRLTNVTIESFDATNYEYRCSWTDGELTYYFHLGDNVVYHFGGLTINVGATYDEIIGVVDYNATTAHYRLNPREQGDFTGGNPPFGLQFVSVNGGVSPYAGNAFDVVVQTVDQFGDPAVTQTDVNFTLFVNTGTSGVDFGAGSATTGTIIAGTSQVTVSGVILEPAGTGVVLTAADNLGSLMAGLSNPFDVITYTPPAIIITEVMQNPAAVGDNDGEYFEVFNTTDADINMIDWIIKDADNDSFKVLLDVVVPPHGFAVFGANADPLLNGDYTADYDYSGMFLSNGADEIILYMPDGTTEVSRIEWDGGPVWPDPNGASMIFTGTVNQLVNDGSLWATSTLREPSYVGNTGDLGSPGTNGTGQNLVSGITVNLTLFLQGPYAGGGTMVTELYNNGYIPLTQPYGPALPYYDINDQNSIPWYYTGTESVAAIPANVVDWVLVQLRDADIADNATSATAIATQPAFLLNDGTVTDLDGVSPLTFNVTPAQNLFAVVFHRNHLGIMSNNPLTASGSDYSYDFSTGETQVYGGANGHIELEPGVWGMIAGDGNGNGLIQNSDETQVWKVDLGSSGYLGGDFNMNGLSQNDDETSIWKVNLGGGGQVPAKAGDTGYQSQVPK
ncbi:MAG: hypothetical protein Kow00127_13750 [Bacteroidales bacterium]